MPYLFLQDIPSELYTSDYLYDYRYQYQAGTNRLGTITQMLCNDYMCGEVDNPVLDAAGNMTDDGNYYGFARRTYGYDSLSRIRTASGVPGSAVVGSYAYNHVGQRHFKSALVDYGPPSLQGTLVTLFSYLPDGKLLGETILRNGVLKEQRSYVWLEDQPVGFQVAVLDGGGAVTQRAMYYLYTDPLNSPTRATNAAGQKVWHWLSTTFGEGYASVSPPYMLSNTQTAGASPINLRFPGQYYDRETDLNYNYFRSYSARLGRYVQHDPIGLAGGLNPYLYAGGNPLRFTDPLGLAPGDNYKTADAAAAAAIRDINPTSIAKNKEYAGWIYKKWLGLGPYSYTAPNEGTSNSSDPGTCSIWDSKEGTYHTHAGFDPLYDNENFSDRDKRISDLLRLPGYLGTPEGLIKKYTPEPELPGIGSLKTIGTGAKK